MIVRPEEVVEDHVGLRRVESGRESLEERGDTGDEATGAGEVPHRNLDALA